jgi:hypothetical protein
VWVVLRSSASKWTTKRNEPDARTSDLSSCPQPLQWVNIMAATLSPQRARYLRRKVQNRRTRAKLARKVHEPGAESDGTAPCGVVWPYFRKSILPEVG